MAGLPASADDAPQTDVARLMAALSSSEFAVRQEATRELIKAGPEAIPHLVRAIQRGDADVIARFDRRRLTERLAAIFDEVTGARAAVGTVH